MNNELKMVGRYALAIAISFAAGKGWITPSQGTAVTNLVVELAGVVIAFAPAVYAAFKVDNTPKVP